MQSTLKVTIGVIVILIIGVGLWWYMGGSPAGMGPAAPANSQNNPPSPDNGQPSMPGSSSMPASSANPGASAASTDNSDASLNQDLNTIDSQMKGLNSDTSNVDQGMNSK